MLKNHDLKQQFCHIVQNSIKNSEKFIDSNKDELLHVAQMFEAWENMILQANNIYAKVEHELLLIFNAAKDAFESLSGIQVELNNFDLRCKIQNGATQAIGLRRIGTVLFVEMFFDNGVKAFVEQVGSLCSNQRDTEEIHIIEVSPNGNSKSVRHENIELFLCEQIKVKMEWFISEVAKRTPIYRIAAKLSKEC